MRGLDVKAHRFEREDDLAADVFAHVDRAQIEVARPRRASRSSGRRSCV